MRFAPSTLVSGKPSPKIFRQHPYIASQLFTPTEFDRQVSMAHFFVIVPACDQNVFESLRFKSIQIFAVDVDEDGTLLHVVNDVREPIVALPALTVSAISLSLDGSLVLARFNAMLADTITAPVARRLFIEDRIEISDVIVEGVQQLARCHSKLLTKTMKSLAELRVVHEEHQRRLTDVEALLTRDNRQPFDLSFSDTPGLDGNNLRINAENRAAQLLPVASRGICAIGLHFASVSPSLNSTINIKLISNEDEIVHGNWQISLGDLLPSWNIFSLSESISGLRRTLCTEITLDGTGEVVLSLGSRQPLPDFRVKTSDLKIDYNLAMRIWAGVPGLPPPVHVGNHVATRGPAGFEEVRIRLGEVDEVASSDYPTATKALSLDAESEAIDGNVAASDYSVGCLRAVLSPSTVLVSAEVTGTPDCEVALATDHSAEDIVAKVATGGDPMAGWTGLVRLDPTGTTRLNMYCAERVGDKRDLFLVCRAASGGDSLRSRVRFSDLKETLAVNQQWGDTSADSSEVPEIAKPPLEMFDVTVIDAEHLVGTGIYGLEHGQGGARWRWLNPDCTLTIQNVRPLSRSVVLEIVAAAPDFNLDNASVIVNNFPSSLKLTSGNKGRLEIEISLPAIAHRGDRTATVQLRLGNFFRPDGDLRQLSVACRAVRLEI